MADPIVVVLQPDPAERARTVEALSSCCERSGIGEAADVEQAAALLGLGAPAGPGAPRLLLVDMAPEAGVKLLQAIRSHAPTAGLAVIALVAGGDRSAQDAWYRAGANSVVARASDDAELREKMRHLVEYWTTVNVANRYSRL